MRAPSLAPLPVVVACAALVSFLACDGSDVRVLGALPRADGAIADGARPSSPGCIGAPPDIALETLDDGFGGFSDGGSGLPPADMRASASAAFGGFGARFRYEAATTPDAPMFRWWVPPWDAGRLEDRVFVHCFVKLDGEAPDASLGLIAFGSDAPDGPSVLLGLGGGELFFGGADDWIGGTMPTGVFTGPAPTDTVARIFAERIGGDGRWHSLETEVVAVSTANVQARIYFDGEPIVQSFAAGTFGHPGSFLGDTIDLGTRTGATRGLARIGLFEFLNSGNTTTGSVSIDECSISTRRIGPCTPP